MEMTRKRSCVNGATVAGALFGCSFMAAVWAETVAGAADSRIRTATYDSAEVYRIEGRVGYQIDIQFEDDESFVGLAAGDVEALSFVSQGSHLFIKPRVARVSTNLTVLTTRRAYHFDYTASVREEGSDRVSDLYALRFVYALPSGATDATHSAAADASELDRLLKSGAGTSRNLDYWYCGHPSLKPVYAADDGVHTWLRFAARAELPAVFARNDDGSESLLNFNVEDGDVVIHRIARKLILRRGQLTGCVVNAAYSGSGDRIRSGTVSPAVQRATRGGKP
jgi:type IV secretion system protein VirB9